jgi:hypothetical protein
MTAKNTTPPADLLNAFRGLESPEQLGPLVVEEGFDAATLHVLAAWLSSDHIWSQPKAPCPDGGRATSVAWRWLVSGWTLDVEYVAKAADVSMSTARAKLELLVANRLIFPDGEMAKIAKAMLQAAIRKALGGKKKDKEKKGDGGPPPTPDSNRKPSETN